MPKNAGRSTEIAEVTSFPPVHLPGGDLCHTLVLMWDKGNNSVLLHLPRGWNELLTIVCWQDLWNPAWQLLRCYHYHLDPGPDHSSPVDAAHLQLVLQVSLDSCPEEHRGKGRYG